MPKKISRGEFLETILKTAGALATGVAFSGCAPGLTSNLSQTPTQIEPNREMKKAMKELGIKNPNDIGDIKGYYMSKHMKGQIEAHAEMRANEYIQEQGMNPEDKDYVYQEILREMLETADEDGKRDGIIRFHPGLKVLRLRKHSWRYLY